MWSRADDPAALFARAWLERFGVTKTVLGGSISGAFDLVATAFDSPVSATKDTEHSALIGAAAHYLRSQ